MNSAPGVYYAMGTLLRVDLRGDASSEVLDIAKLRIVDTIQRLEQRLSVYTPQSDISRVNANAGKEPVPVSTETFEAVQKALHYGRLTQGACDPTVGPLLHLWGIYDRQGTAPDDAARQKALELVDYQDVEANADLLTLFLPKNGMCLDLGWIGKGFALDAALHTAKAEPGLEEVSMDFGGQLVFWNRHATPTRAIVIDVPDISASERPRLALTHNGSVSTTSNAERGADISDPLTRIASRVGHIIDPRTGIPARGLRSVSVVAPTAIEADALSTALYVLGTEQGRACMAQFPAARAVFA